MSLSEVEMSLPKLILSLAMSLVGVEMALFLLLCFRNYFSCVSGKHLRECGSGVSFAGD